IGRIFVGRDAELEQLQQLWKEASAGERRVALLAGEPGVGKTRLGAELAIRVHEEGGVVLVGRCDEDLGVPYQPFVEALRHFVDHTPPPDLRERLGRYGGELARLVPELSKRAPDLPPPLQSDPETERYRLFDAVAAWLSAASSEDPILLVLDDLQWAAKPTLLLLRHVVRASEPARLLILGTYRDTELTHDHPLVELVADLRRDGGLERLPLSGLDDLAVAAIVEQAAGHVLDEHGAALARAIYQETEGNPFFVREVLRHLVETKAVEREAGAWASRVPIEELGIPEGVRDVVGRRLSRLSQVANETLRLAAVVGAEFDVELVGAAGELAETELLGTLDEAVEARLVSEVTPSRFRFSHALVRTTLYESLTGARKVALHRHVAEAIENAYAGAVDDHLPALAHHWSRASAPAADTARAVDYALRAGDRALAQLANDEAVVYYHQALELLDASQRPDDHQRTATLISLGEAQRRAGDPAHRETLLRASQLAAEHDDADALARAALANTRGTWASAIGEVDDDRVAALEAALDALGAEETPTRARLLAAVGLELTYAGTWERRTRLADEALAIARRCGDAPTLAHVLLRRFTTINLPHTLDERLANTEELVGLAEHLGDPNLIAWALLLRFRGLIESGDMGEADRCLNGAERLAADLGQPTFRWLVGAIGTARVILAGNLDEGERRAHDLFSLAQASGQRDAQTFLAAHLFVIRYDQG
ncbi:MAG: AAA family ATPase, partial [Actinobacteria bacterium]|nr:AAA family ATPase [Actinomycetota bacterium]